MDVADMKQLCLDLSNSAIALFDIIDDKGIEAPLADYEAIQKLKTVIDSSYNIRDYYYRRNIQRMLALGVSPDSLLKAFSEE